MAGKISNLTWRPNGEIRFCRINRQNAREVSTLREFFFFLSVLSTFSMGKKGNQEKNVWLNKVVSQGREWKRKWLENKSKGSKKYGNELENCMKEMNENS